MIKRLKIRDFKSIRNLDLELGPVTVLIGRSGTGKSNIVQAIRFLRNVLLNQGEAINFEFGWDRIVPVGEKAPKTTIEVTFSVPGEDLDYRYVLGFGSPPRGAGMQLVHEQLDLGDSCVFARSFKERRRDPDSPRAGNVVSWEWDHEPKVATPPRHDNYPLLGAFPALQKVVFAHAALSSGIGYYHFPASILSFAASPQHGGNMLQAIPGLRDDAANYREIMRKITQDFYNPQVRKSVLASLKTVNPSIVSVELDSLFSPQRAIIGHEATGKIFELMLEQESDGLRRYYAHLLALYQTPPKLTSVFEEPENAIFPGALSLLADEFKAAPRENRGQVILTTHNPTLLDRFDVDSIRVVEMKDGQTVAGPLSKEQREAVKDHLLTTGELLTVDRPKTDVPVAA